MAINRTKVLNKAQKYQRKGHLDKAIQEYRTLVEDDPSDMRSMLKIADLYSKQGQRAEALASYKSVAYYYLNDDIYDKSVAIFKQALRLADSDAELHRDLGEAYHRMGRLKEAIAQYHQAQRIYAQHGDGEAQRDILERMVRLEPEDPALRIKLAEHYARAGMRGEAIGLFRYAAQQFEEDGRVEDYLKVSERIIYLKPANLELRDTVVRRYMELGEYKRALKHLQTLFKSNRTNLDVLRMLAIAFERTGQPDKAALVLGEVGLIHERNGQTQQRDGVYRQIMRLVEDGPADPSNNPQLRELAARAREVLAPEQPSVEDSGSLPGIAETGNLRADQDPLRQSHQEPPEADVMAEVEFLDDDLEEVMVPANQAPPSQPSEPAARREPPPEQAPQQLAQPQQPAGLGSGEDFMSFAEDTIDEIGTIGLERLQRYPEGEAPPQAQNQQPDAQPPLEEEELLELELEPEPIDLDADAVELIPEVAEEDGDEDVQQAIDEMKVFLKYGLTDKAIQTLQALTRRYPESIKAREELANLYVHQGQGVLAADQYVEMANIVRSTPARAVEFLEKAADHMGDRSRVEAIAGQMGIPFGDDLDTQDELMELDFIGDDDDFGGVFGSIANTPDGVGRDTAGAGGEASIMELDEDDLISDVPAADVAETGQFQPSGAESQDVFADEHAGLAFATEDIVTDDELEFDEADLVDVDRIAELPESAESDLNSLDLNNSRPRQPGVDQSSSDVGFDLTEDEADAMFDDLFGDASGSSGLSMSFSGSQDLDGLADVDMLIEQGLVTEAEEALEELAHQNPNSATIERRKLSLENVRAGAGDNPFGAQSLSGMFSLKEPTQSEMVEDGPPDKLDLADATNTNFELGVSYMDVGLFEDALEEFRLALDDHEVSIHALYNLAMCEVKLGRVQDASQHFRQLQQNPNAFDGARQAAALMLQNIQ